VYNGGAVQPSTQTFAIYWGPASAFSTSFILDTEQFLRDVGGSQWYQVLTEYTGSYNGSKQTVANTSTFLGGYADTKNVAPARVTVADIAAEIASVIAHEPPSWKPGITTQFHIFLPPGSAYGAGDCGYHDSTTLAGSPVVFEVYQYPSTNLDTGCGNDPWQLPAADGNSQASRVIATMAHEMAESVTDPIFVSGHGTGWHGSIPESEVADVCGGDVGRFATTIPGANIVINGHGYRLPAIWSITAKACKPNF
jgi:hypothetical protein